MIINDYILDGISVMVCYSYVPSEDEGYLTPPRQGYAELLSVWIPSDPMVTDILKLLNYVDVSTMEEYFFDYETDKLYEI